MRVINRSDFPATSLLRSLCPIQFAPEERDYHNIPVDVLCFALTPDWKTIVCGSSDGCLSVWDVDTGACVFEEVRVSGFLFRPSPFSVWLLTLFARCTASGLLSVRPQGGPPCARLPPARVLPGHLPGRKARHQWRGG